MTSRNIQYDLESMKSHLTRVRGIKGGGHIGYKLAHRMAETTDIRNDKSVYASVRQHDKIL